MHELTIYRLYFTDSDCYRKGVRQTPRGVQVHSTGANNPNLRRYVGPDDGRLGVNPNGNTHNRPGGNVCASAYIGKLADGTVAVYQTLPWDMRCWLSGSGDNGNANRLGYIGFEICEDSTENEQYFDEAVKRKAVLLAAYLCMMMGVTPYEVLAETPDGPAYAVMDHAELHRLGLASNHGDIGLWLKKFGYNFQEFRGWVEDAMNEGVTVTIIDAGTDKVIDQKDYQEVVPVVNHPTLKRGDKGPDVAYLQTLLSDVGTPIKGDGIFGPATEAAVRVFQAAHGLKTDCIVGPATWAALEEAAGHDADDQDDPGAGDSASPDDPPEDGQTVTMALSDFNALKAAIVAANHVIRKYESLG